MGVLPYDGRPRPWRLWGGGTGFGSLHAGGDQDRLGGQLQSGVELLPGAEAAVSAADGELLRLLLACLRRLGIGAEHGPTLLVGHHGVLSALLDLLGQPLLATTLILPAETEALNDPHEIRERLEHQIQAVIDPGASHMEPTTVIDLRHGEPVRVC